MTLDKLKPGLIVYDVHSYVMGNTTARSIGIWHVSIIDINAATGLVIASWNGNPARHFSKREWSKWRLKKPVLVKSGWGHRLQTREEKAASK